VRGRKETMARVKARMATKAKAKAKINAKSKAKAKAGAKAKAKAKPEPKALTPAEQAEKLRIEAARQAQRSDAIAKENALLRPLYQGLFLQSSPEGCRCRSGRRLCGGISGTQHWGGSEC